MPAIDAVLDHVAVATEAWAAAWPRYVAELGGEWASGGLGVGFAPSQLRFGNGARLEILQPWAVESNDFLRRFLDSNGSGPHHLTFKVPDFDAALDAAGQAGFSPVGVDRSDPGWLEAFLHPRQATGVVVQLAQAAGSWSSPAPEGFPAERPPVPADLTHVTHAVAELERGLDLFAALLGGREVRRDEAPDGSWTSVTLGWAGPMGVRLVAPGPAAPPDSPVRRWLAGRNGRVHHLAFAQPGTAPGDLEIPGVAADQQPAQVIEPDDNLGTRLVVSRASGRGGPDSGSR